jgi:hypothetical protein
MNGAVQPACENKDPSMTPLTKTNRGLGTSGGAIYPHRMDDSNGVPPDLNFGAFPISELETPATMDFPFSDAYAEAIVDQSGLVNGGMRNGDVFPSANQYFGDAVSNALDLINAGGGSAFPSFNLDGDRGYGWKTWLPQTNTFPGSGQVDPVPEP